MINITYVERLQLNSLFYSIPFLRVKKRKGIVLNCSVSICFYIFRSSLGFAVKLGADYSPALYENISFPLATDNNDYMHI